VRLRLVCHRCFPNKVFKLARDEGVTWDKPISCVDHRGVYQGVTVKFIRPTAGFFLGLSRLGFPTPRNFVIGQVHPRWDLTYASDATLAWKMLNRGMKQKYNRGLVNQFEFSYYGGTYRSSRNRDVYLKTNSMVRIELRIQKAAAVARLGLNDPATLADYRNKDFVALFDRLLTWQPYTLQDLMRLRPPTTEYAKRVGIGRTLEFIRDGWLHGRAKLTISEVIEGWGLPMSVPGQLVHSE
jgi:hypothetical protein